MTDLLPIDHIRPDALADVGGKALSLAQLAAGGLPVPPGFCLTTAAHRRLRDRRVREDVALNAAVCAAYRTLGEGPVAVRSSATAEDGAVSSFAGQQDTLLGVVGIDAIFAAIEQCWASLDTERARIYRRQQGIRDADMYMAVVVQKLVPAEIAGVLFTRDPLDASGTQMLVEASWGLGECVVSGRVMPDRFHLERDSGRVRAQQLSRKTVQRTLHREEAVPPHRQHVACLDERQLAELAALGRKVEAFYGSPRDVEWAFAGGQFWLLQARPITTGGQAEREQVRREEIAILQAKAEPRGTVWSRFNLSEVLPEPTPMTWHIIQRYLMSGKGGFGRMYRDLGYDPHPSLDDEGIFDLVCGRPYCNLSREPRLYGQHLPFEHPFKSLKADPRRALYPSPIINPARFSVWSLLTMPVWLPWVTWSQRKAGVARQRLMTTFADRFRADIAPSFQTATARAGQMDVSTLDDAALLRHLEEWCEATLGAFACDSLKPTALAALAMASLTEKLAVVMGAERAGEMARDLVMGVRPDAEADLPGALREVADGKMTREAFLTRFGHRGSDEMELSKPRWHEAPDSLERIGGGHAPPSQQTAEEHLAAIPRLAAFQRDILLNEMKTLHTYLALRETGKHYLLYGYALIRRALCEIDRRGRLSGGVFYLTPEELPALMKGDDLSALIAQRRRRRALALGLEAPTVIFSDDLEAIGRAEDIASADLLQGVPLSAGVAEGPALVLDQPHVETLPGEGYILVCPSTDPAWVPLFVPARGLVMETGGVLSHGAIVAREFGLPAVAGVPGVTRRIKSGQRLRVDGGRGIISVLSD